MRILFIFLALTFSAFTFAYPIEKSIGFGLGYTWTESVFNDKVIEFGGIETPTYTDVTNSSMPFNLYGNLRFHKHYGIEVGYINYGKINFDKTLTKVQDNNSSSGESDFIEKRVRDAAISISGFYLSHVLYMPISDAIQLQAKAGVVFGSAEYSDLETLTIAETSDTPPQVIPSVNASSEAFAKAHLAAAIRYLSSTNTAWRLQLSQIEISHDGEQEIFTQWFTQLSYEIKL